MVYKYKIDFLKWKQENMTQQAIVSRKKLRKFHKQYYIFVILLLILFFNFIYF